jgi:STE24 endopeptidase
MQKYQLIVLFGYVVVEGFEYWLRFLNLRHMKRYGTHVPEGFEGYIDEPALLKTHAYTVETSSLSLIESVFGNIVMIVFLFGGVLGLYSSWIGSLGLPFAVKGTLFFLLLSCINTVISIPFSLYATFKIENKYGFNTMTPILWVADLAKSLIISTVILGTVSLGGFSIVQNSPGYWWLFVWGFFFVLSIFLMYISPYVIEPLFNKFTPLKGGELEENIRELMNKAGIRVGRVFTIDASKRSRHTNAYFTGIGRVKRIVLFDTLMEMMSQSEILAVLAHEAGHWKKKHVLKRIVLFELLSLAGAYLSFIVLRSNLLSDMFAIKGEAFFAELVILGFIFGMAAFPFTPLMSFFSRRHEEEADRFAVELTRDPGSLATSLIKLSKDNLSNLHPHPLYAKFYYSHPPIVERIRKIRGEI